MDIRRYPSPHAHWVTSGQHVTLPGGCELLKLRGVQAGVLEVMHRPGQENPEAMLLWIRSLCV